MTRTTKTHRPECDRQHSGFASPCNTNGAPRATRPFEVCPSCKGKGTSSAYLGAFTSDDMHDLGDEFIEDYFEGRYDRACDTCRGKRVVALVECECGGWNVTDADDHDRITGEQCDCYAADRAERAYFARIEGSGRGW